MPPVIGFSEFSRPVSDISEYVTFSPEYLRQMFNTIWVNFGTIFSVCIYIFLVVIGVYVSFDLIRRFIG